MDILDPKPKVKTAYPDTYSLIKNYSRENRAAQTDAEEVLWQNIRNKSLGVKFRRQHIIGDYIADFICLDHKLILEIDGGYHLTNYQEQEDLIRSQWLYKQGFYVLRFSNEQVLGDISFVLDRIKEIINQFK